MIPKTDFFQTENSILISNYVSTTHPIPIHLVVEEKAQSTESSEYIWKSAQSVIVVSLLLHR